DSRLSNPATLLRNQGVGLMRRFLRLWVPLVLSLPLALTDCGGGTNNSTPPPPPPPPPPAQQAQLTVTVTGSGTVTSSPAGINCPGTCTAKFNNGTTFEGEPSDASDVDSNGATVTAYNLQSACTENPSPSWNESHVDRNRYDPTNSNLAPMDGFVHTAAGDASGFGLYDVLGHRA